ncbi:hypothetical protein GGR32_000660 [Mesonia hippocampi]|uniref:Uncharacterized protein n=1 Tax=Mesonia hippocampi TaxID=1628250 RepID=A0A840ESM5_9FLAO|nr:hypothetical protein [Mesonia hippocampi]
MYFMVIGFPKLWGVSIIDSFQRYSAKKLLFFLFQLSLRFFIKNNP